VQQSRRTNDLLPCWLRTTRATTPSPLASMASQRRHRVAVSHHRCGISCACPTPPLPASMADHRGKCNKATPHL
jgi:hypothetical protein